MSFCSTSLYCNINEKIKFDSWPALCLCGVYTFFPMSAWVSPTFQSISLATFQFHCPKRPITLIITFVSSVPPLRSCSLSYHSPLISGSSSSISSSWHQSRGLHISSPHPTPSPHNEPICKDKETASTNPNWGLSHESTFKTQICKMRVRLVPALLTSTGFLGTVINAVYENDPWQW